MIRVLAMFLIVSARKHTSNLRLTSKLKKEPKPSFFPPFSLSGLGSASSMMSFQQKSSRPIHVSFHASRLYDLTSDDAKPVPATLLSEKVGIVRIVSQKPSEERQIDGWDLLRIGSAMRVRYKVSSSDNQEERSKAGHRPLRHLARGGLWPARPPPCRSA